MTIIAIDADLRKVYGWCDTCGIAICKAAPDIELILEHVRLHSSDRERITVLLEIAGAVDYTDNKAVAHNKRRWTIWNVACAAALDATLCLLEGKTNTIELLVAPSSTWTSGYPLEVRHKLAKANAPQRDLRECQSMIWSYRVNAALWIRLNDFLARL